MTNISLDLSGKIDPITVDLLRALNSSAKQLRVPFFVVGATARNLIFEVGYGIEIKRKTEDLDFGVMVDGWKQYEILIQKLIETGEFVAKDSRQHRVYFRDSLPVDVIPFGGVEAEDGAIVWPHDQSIRMNVQGFEDAWHHSIMVRVAPGDDIRFVSPAGLAMLKILAWKDRHNEFPDKDATDLALILTCYPDAGMQDRLYDTHADLLKEAGFDYQYAGARMLGRDMATLMSTRTKDAVLGILEEAADPNKNDRLIIALQSHLADRDYESALILLQSLKLGIQEQTHIRRT